MCLKRIRLTLLAVVVSLAPAGVTAKPKPLRVVQDLYYGVGLYYLFQDKFFDAIVRLRAAQSMQRIEHHKEDTELLLGGLYMNYGMHLEAQRIFQALLDRDTKIKPRTRDQAWFLLGKGLYNRGFYAQARSALEHQGETLTDSENAERQVLLGNLWLRLNKPENAVTILHGIETDTPDNPWVLYAKYNEGVALMSLKRTGEALQVLARLGEIDAAEGSERQSLRDKANLALGFHYGGLQQAELAKKYLEKIRVRGWLSNRALLGMGWTHMDLKNYKAALVDWMVLSQRDAHDPAVLEVFLAIPTAYQKLDAYREALEHFQAAIDIYKDESREIREAIDAVKAGRVLQSLVEDDDKTGLRAELRLRKPPSLIENHYLIELMASNGFQAALKSYLNLRFLERNLQQRDRDVVVFKDILDFRRNAYQSRLPAIMERYRRLNLSRMRAVSKQFAARVAHIEKQGTSMELATAKEKQRLAQLDALEHKRARITTMDTKRQAGLIRLLRGTIVWDIHSEHPQRLGKEQRRVVEMELELDKAEKLSASLIDTQSGQAVRFAGFENRLREAGNRVQSLQQRLPEQIRRHETFIAEMSVRELERQLKRLDIYLTQAQLGVAQIMDRDRERKGNAP